VVGVKGTFKGIVREPVDRPYIKEIGTYNTVVYGELSMFVLVIPENAEVKRRAVSEYSDCIEIVVNDKSYSYKLTYGDAYFPDKLVPIESCP
jgi:hypothetical protein